MTKTNKKCNDNCACSHVDGKIADLTKARDTYQTATKESLDYGFYSNLLQRPFEKLADLKKAEEVYREEQKAKEAKAAQKKSEAKKVEEAFKALNAARKAYKEDLTQLTREYSEELNNLKKAFELGKKDINSKLAEAEDNFDKAHKEFTAAHPEGYHLTLKDGDFETTISGTNSKSALDATACSEIFKMIFGL